MPKEVYIFSGLGADELVFKLIDFSDLSVTHVKWISPQKNETIEQYAARLLLQIQTPNPILVGLSFGGIMAIEVGKLIRTEKIILLATAKTFDEVPVYYRFLGKLRIHHLLPMTILKSSNFLTYWFFGLKSRADKKLLKQILVDTDALFLRWAIGRIVNWKNTELPQNAYHIHGDCDRILPLKFTNSNLIIKNGGHLMVLTHSEELSLAIRKELID